jgi:hypothetical protein
MRAGNHDVHGGTEILFLAKRKHLKEIPYQKDHLDFKTESTRMRIWCLVPCEAERHPHAPFILAESQI